MNAEISTGKRLGVTAATVLRVALIPLLAAAAVVIALTFRHEPPAAPPVHPEQSIAGALVVGPSDPYRSIQEALAAARAGDTIVVRGGTYTGPLLVDRSVTLQGIGMPVIDGGGNGSVVTLAAPGTVIRGFTVRRSGRSLNDNDAGIEVRATGVTVAENHLVDVLNGISLDKANQSVLRANRISGKDLPIAQRGDGIRLWYSSDVLIERNQVEAARDCVIWYSKNVRLIGNTIAHGRYGLHFMYDDGAQLVGNVLRDNSVGAYLMYSRGVTLRGNLMAANRGPSGYGLGLKDMDDVVVENNWLVDNRVGIWVDNSPRSIDAKSQVHANVFAYNDIGLTLQPSIQRNTFWENTFRENYQQVSIAGGGKLRGNQWEQNGHGNYWSDYGGFDANGDGIGDMPYRAEAIFDDLMDRRPTLRFFQLGLGASVIEFAARAFPTLRPDPKLVDNAPLMSPPTMPTQPGQTPVDPWPALGVGLGLLTLAGGIFRLGRQRTGSTAAHPPAPQTRTVLDRGTSMPLQTPSGPRSGDQVLGQASIDENCHSERTRGIRSPAPRGTCCGRCAESLPTPSPDPEHRRIGAADPSAALGVTSPQNTSDKARGRAEGTRTPHPNPLPRGEGIGSRALPEGEPPILPSPHRGRGAGGEGDHPSPHRGRGAGGEGGLPPALLVEGLTKRFGRLTVLDGLAFAVAPGEVVAIWGPNGAGKTTALKCILGLLPCTGRVSIAGRDALRTGKIARQSLGYVPQEVAFHDDLTVAETATFYSRIRRIPADRARDRLTALGLTAHIDKPIGALSGGLRQRLALALALLGDPPVLLLDEPTSNLDAAGRQQVLQLLGLLRRQGTAVLFASHRLEEVEALADRVVVLERGRVAFACRPTEFAARVGLRLFMKLRIAGDQQAAALSALRAGGLSPQPYGDATVAIDVLPNEKAIPIRLLELAGIPVVDFTIEDDASRHDATEEPWMR